MQSVNKTITITNEEGKNFNAYIAKPSAEKGFSAPVIIVIQDALEANTHMRAVCDSLAYQGYVTICPDLLQEQKEYAELDGNEEYQNKIVQDLSTTINFVKENSECNCNGKVATIGYGFGGKLAYLMAMLSDVDCSISYYGVGIENVIDGMKSIKNPLMLHIAGNNKFVKSEAEKLIMATVKNYPHIEVKYYKTAEHGFACIGNDGYNDEDAQKANYNTIDFLARCLIGDE